MSTHYQSFVAGNIMLGIRRLRPSGVISIALSPEKQDQQNVRKLKGLNDSDWRELVDEIYADKNADDEDLIKRVAAKARNVERLAEELEFHIVRAGALSVYLLHKDGGEGLGRAELPRRPTASTCCWGRPSGAAGRHGGKGGR